MAQHSSSRRNFLRSALLSTTVLGAERSLTANDTRTAAPNQGVAKNVIMMVSDGLGLGMLSLAHDYSLQFNQRTPNWLDFYRKTPVVRALAETYSANSLVTDSAAAASAWGGGQRIQNGVLNIDSDGKPLTPLQTKLKKAGKRVGLVSTATITHATPAGFAANQAARSNEEGIAQQYLEREVDVLLGGGLKFFSPERLEAFRKANYDVVTQRDAMLQSKPAPGKRLLGVFSESHLPHEVDRVNVPELAAKVPSLAEMSERALAQLEGSENGFFLMIEGARIDHACHNNDSIAAIRDQIAFDDAIGAVLKFVEKHPDTLLIITADHGTGGPQLNGMSKKRDQNFAPGIYGATTEVFRHIGQFTRSFEWMRENGGKGLSGKPLQEMFAKYTKLEFTTEEIKELQGTKVNLRAANEIFAPHTGIGWTSNNHTSEMVEFGAYGPGSNEFPAFIQNFEVHNKLLKIMGVA